MEKALKKGEPFRPASPAFFHSEMRNSPGPISISPEPSFCFRPTRALVDLAALRHNYRLLRGFIGPGTRFLAVVKADAYGHGALPCSKVLKEEGCDFLGVALVEEGIELRRGGIQGPILVMGGADRENRDAFIPFDLTPAIHDMEGLSLMEEEGKRRARRIPIHIKIDTGMSRLGFREKEIERVAIELSRSPHLLPEGAFSHFVQADVEDPTRTVEQTRLFSSLVSIMKHAGIDPPILHLSNSAALVRFPETHMGMVRPGLCLYAGHPSPAVNRSVAIRPILTLKSAVTAVRRLLAGEGASYRWTFVASRETLVATVPAGYADGIPRSLSNRGFALVRGKRAPVIGAVCMDLTMLDVTDIPGVLPGEEVVLVGRQGNEEITASEMASWANTIPYEILTGITRRVPRIYEGR